MNHRNVDRAKLTRVRIQFAVFIEQRQQKITSIDSPKKNKYIQKEPNTNGTGALALSTMTGRHVKRVKMQQNVNNNKIVTIPKVF